MIKAAFFDIDGTLLSFNTHRVSEGTMRAFERLHRAGVRTFLSTGRPEVLIPSMPVSFDAYVTMNGGLVFSPDGVLLRNPIPQEEASAWLDYAAQHNVCTMVFTEQEMYASQLNAAALGIRDQLEFEMPPVVDIERLRGLETFQIIALMPPEADAEVGTLLPHCRFPRWHPAFTDIVSAANSKSAGMEAVCRHFGIDQEETIAFGDGGNDIDMLQWAGVGIAMGNAADSVKQHADLVTTSVDDEGIENAINQLLP